MKGITLSRSILKFVMILFYGIAVGVLSQHFGANNLQDPVISLGSWKEVDFSSEWHTNSSPPLGKTPYKNSIFVPSTIRGLSLICNATYPIEWKFHRERWGGRSRLQFAIQTTRISDGLDVRSFSTELSILGFDSSVSGNYTCQKVGYNGQSTSIYIFWEGASPPFLTLARSYRKPAQIPFQLKSGSFILPCTVAVPNVVPKLSKTVGDKEVELRENNSVSYDPRIGFTLTKLKTPFGRYMCQVGDTDENESDGDVITFDVIDAYDGPKPEFNDTITHTGAFIEINSSKKEITCCSSSPKPPRLKLVECDHPTICALAKHTLHRMESSKRKNGSCSIVDMRVLRAGIFRCVGDGIDVVREYFYPMPEQPAMPFAPPRKSPRKNRHRTANSLTTTKKPGQTPIMPYFSWNEADEQKMMYATRMLRPVYIGENRTFYCKASHFYYAQGIVWGVSFNNESFTDYVDGTEYNSLGWRHWPGLAGSRHFQIIYGKNIVTLEIAITANLSSLTCYAPIWNSTGWGKKEIDLDIRIPQKPTIQGPVLKEVTWYLNDTKKYLECSFQGEPQPKIVWKKGNRTMRRRVVVVNGTSQLPFGQIGPRVQGEYKCIISNVAGTVTRTFKVTVLHSTSSTMTVILVLSLLGFTAASIGIGFLFNHLKSQKNVISHLANLAFKDVTNSNGGGVGEEGFSNRTPAHINTNGIAFPPIPTVVLPEKDTPGEETGYNRDNGFLSQTNQSRIDNEQVNQPDVGVDRLQPSVPFETFRKL